MGHLRTKHRRKRKSHHRNEKENNIRNRDIGNVLDIGTLPLRYCKGLLTSHIKYRLRLRESLVVVTHNVVEKIQLLREVCNSMDDVKIIVKNENNLGSYLIYN